MGGASAEWVMLQAAIPKQEYVKLAARFNPVKFHAESPMAMRDNQAGVKS